eukprot:2717150-Amphidinium_carterae.3
MCTPAGLPPMITMAMGKLTPLLTKALRLTARWNQMLPGPNELTLRTRYITAGDWLGRNSESERKAPFQLGQHLRIVRQGPVIGVIELEAFGPREWATPSEQNGGTKLAPHQRRKRAEARVLLRLEAA